MAIQELFDLTGKVALVTGGGRGIGEVAATALAEAGARVVISGRREDYLSAASQKLTAAGHACHVVVSDVTQPDDVAKTVQAALDAYGQLDILVNNAGQTWGQATEEMPFERWRQVIEVNLNGMFLMSQVAGRHMLARGSGRIINVASVAGLGSGEHKGN
jgi:NAD(P)-dependent dehydrogenase (short-subunit alcohol dehydrogenase family)